MRKEKLYSIRKQKKITQQQLADIIATDVSNYSRKESGDVKITESEWEKIANFLGVPIEMIYEDEEVKKSESEIYSINNQDHSGVDNTNNLHIELIKHLMDYITLLKEENRRLKGE